ncbi:DUF3099 domain-containing protein [Microbacterium sp. GXF7504]
MKPPSAPQSATSLPRAPREDAHARSTKYLVMMAVRILCFALMVLITPYGWYTWVFAAGAVLLPYIAVVVANVGQDLRATTAVAPERALPDAPPAAETPAADPTSRPTVIRIAETTPPADPDAGSGSDEPGAGTGR